MTILLFRHSSCSDHNNQTDGDVRIVIRNVLARISCGTLLHEAVVCNYLEFADDESVANVRLAARSQNDCYIYRKRSLFLYYLL